MHASILNVKEHSAPMSAVNPKKLPIRDYADKILEAVRSNPVTIVIGETGSGKTTQISQVCNARSNGMVLDPCCRDLQQAFASGGTCQSHTVSADSRGSWLC